jgi:hypothetical protein
MPIADGLWAITSYFNPMRYRRRLCNFRLFRKHLNIPLVVVELAFGEEFELHKQDAELLIQLRGGAVLWQKECLLNIALLALPSSCRKVAWLDCDIIFGNVEWGYIANSLLDRFSMIQLFKRMHHLSPQWMPAENPACQVTLTRPSAVFSLMSGIPATECLGYVRDTPIMDRPALGFAWASRREVLKQHGFFDACILGGGDRAMISAVTHCFEEMMVRHCMNEHERQRYLDWAIPFSEPMRADDIGFLDADIFHLWHGDIRHRAYRPRYEGLQPFQFDPFIDIEKTQDGPWRWSTNKPQMHKYVATYFASRKEDG